MTWTKRLWPYLLAMVGLTLLWLDHPVGLRYVRYYSVSPRGGGHWETGGWALGSVWPILVGICALAFAVLEIVVRLTSKRDRITD